MNTATGKVCTGCGADVSQKKRVKDAAGNYYCEQCAEKARQRQHASAHGPHPANAGKVCTNCGVAIGALQHLVEWNGHPVCTSCRDTLELEAQEQAARRQQQAEEDAKRVRDAEEASLAASRMSQDADRRRYRVLLRTVGCVLGVVLFGIAAKWMANDKDPFGSRLEGGLAIGFLIAGAWNVVRYKCLTPRPLMASMTTDLPPALALLWHWTSYAAVLFGLVGVLVFGAWGGAKLGVVLFGDGDLWWWVGLIVGGVVSLCVILPVGMYLDARYCPNCHKLKARIERVEFLGQQAVTTRTYETATVHDGPSVYSPTVQTIKIPITQTIFVNRYRRHRHCMACGHRWTT